MFTMRQRIAHVADEVLRDLNLDYTISAITETTGPVSSYAIRFVDRRAVPEDYFWIHVSVDDDAVDDTTEAAIRRRLSERAAPPGRMPADAGPTRVAADMYEAAVRSAEIAARARADHQARVAASSDDSGT